MTRIKELAADGIRRVERTQAFKDLVTPRNVLSVLLVFGAMGYCEYHGRHHGGRQSSVTRADQVSDSLVIVHDSTEQHAVHLTEATTNARTTKAQYTKAAAHVKVVGHEIAIDGGPPQASVPSSVVAPIITSAEIAITDLSSALDTAHAVIASQSHEIALTTERAEIAEAASSPGWRHDGKVALIAIGLVGLGKLVWEGIKVFK